MLCEEGGVCSECSGGTPSCPDTCPDNFFALSIERNGCPVCECAPLSQCVQDSDCQPWEICYAGSQCEDGCTEPWCCFGNQCSQPNCAPGIGIGNCAAFGCHAGDTCLSACEEVVCDCNGADWDCAGTSGGETVVDCAWACTSP
jgi:hypothetical protein